MDKKIKLIFPIIAFILVAFFMGWAIWASTADIGIGGDIAINSDKLEATITGKMYGHHQDHMTYDTAQQLQGADWTMDDENQHNFLKWENLNVDFVDVFTDVVIELTIQNNNSTNSIAVNVDNKTVTDGANFTLTIENEGTNAPNLIGVGETITYKIIFSVVDKDLKVSGEFDVIFSIAYAV